MVKLCLHIPNITNTHTLSRHSAFLDAKQHNYVLASLLCDMVIKKQICKSALYSLCVVGRSRLSNVLRLINTGHISLSPCEWGKNLSRPNRPYGRLTQFLNTLRYLQASLRNTVVTRTPTKILVMHFIHYQAI